MAGANNKGMGISTGTRYAFGGMSGPVYDDTDANANLLMWDMEPADGTNVPVFAVGIDIFGVDLGLFDGVTFPSMSVVDNDRDSAVGLAFTDDDIAEIVLYGNASQLRLPSSAALDSAQLTSPLLTTPEINDTSLDHQYVFGVSELTDDRTVTLPLLTGNDTFVFEAHTQTLTNKTIDADNNTISNLAHGAEVDNPSSGVHGVTGSVVGTSDSQTLTNKTLTQPTIGDFSNATHDHTSASEGGEILTFISAFKSSATTRNSTSTLATDPDLTLSVSANTTYEFELYFIYNSEAAPDFKYQIVVPSGASVSAVVVARDASAVDLRFYNTGAVSSGQLAGTGGDVGVMVTGVLIIGGNAGSVDFDWAQNTSNGGDTTVQAGSWMRIREA